MSIVDKKIVEKCLQDLVDEQTPAPGYVCKTCGGPVKRQVSGSFRRQFTYDPPECTRCGRTYVFAKHAPTYGEQEFLKILEGRVEI